MLGKVVNRGLNTIDETKAQAICNDAIALFSLPTIRQEKPSPKFQAYERRAVEIVFDENFARLVFDIPEQAFTHQDIAQTQFQRKLRDGFQFCRINKIGRDTRSGSWQ